MSDLDRLLPTVLSTLGDELPPALRETLPAERVAVWREVVRKQQSLLSESWSALLLRNDPEPALHWAQQYIAEAKAAQLGLSDLLLLIDVFQCRLWEAVARSEEKGGAAARPFRSSAASACVAGCTRLRQVLTEAWLTADERTTQIVQLEALIDQVRDMACLTTLTGKPFYLNATARRRWGVAEGPLPPSLTLVELLAPATLTLLRDQAQAAVQRSGSWQGRGELRHLVSRRTWPAEIGVHLIRRPSGTPLAVAMLFVEPAGAERSARAAPEDDALYAMLLDSLPLNVFRKDLEGRFTFANHRCCQTLGKPLAELLGMSDRDLFPPEQAEKYRADDQRIIASGQPQELVERQDTPDGRGCWIQTWKAPVLDAAGRPCGIHGIFWNVTDQRQAEDALQESEARKTAILESALDPIVTINAQGLICEFNRAAEQAFRRPRAEVLGKDPASILFPPESGGGHHQRIDRYMAAGTGSLIGQRLEVVAMRAGGELFPAEMAMTINRMGGQPVFTFFLRDISQRRQAEEIQRKQHEELSRSNAELQQFAYAASHDLQEPLRKIQAFGDRLRSRCGEQLSTDGQEYLERMLSAARRMQELIQGLLELSRVTTKAQRFVAVDLAEVARQVVSDLEVRIEQTGGQITIGTLPVIDADPLQMRLLLQNLLGNALKFHQPGQPPRVEVQAELLSADDSCLEERTTPGPELQCRLEIRDHGIGFDPAQAERIFGVFQRLHTREEFEGTGLGLAICRKIVDRHRGRIAAEGEPGHGSRFIITLPVQQPTAGVWLGN